jgi:hypothetical protein
MLAVRGQRAGNEPPGRAQVARRIEGRIELLRAEYRVEPPRARAWPRQTPGQLG